MIRFILFSIFFIYLTFLHPSTASAHGGPPFIKVNGKANVTNPAASGSVFFKVPNEIAAENFVVNQSLSFGIDTSLLPVTPDQVSPEEFLWEFGNNKTATGLSATNTYTKSGSYIVILKVKDPNYKDPIELESMQINILPNKDYSTPKAVIEVNNKKITNPFEEPFGVDKNSEVKFSGANSEGKIENYKWDFGDGTPLVTGEKVEHKFDFSSQYAYSYFPILRVEDENGLYSDTIVQIISEESTSQTTNSSTDSAKSNGINFVIFGAIGFLIAIVFAGLLFFKKTSEK